MNLPPDLNAMWRDAPEEIPAPDLESIRKAAQRFQRRKLGRNIEIIRLDGDPFHPPVTGGNSASSRAVPIA